jgi:uncharacterized protein YycO
MVAVRRQKNFLQQVLIGLVFLASIGTRFAHAEPTQIEAGSDCGFQLQIEQAIPAEEAMAQMQAKLDNFTRLAEETLSTRARAISLYHYLQDKKQHNEPFSGQDLQRLHSGSSDLLTQRAALLKIAQEHECWLDDSSPAARSLPTPLRAAGISMSLSAALLLYDNYLVAISMYRDNTALRTQLNRSDKTLARRQGELNAIAASFTSIEKRARTRRAIVWYERQGPALHTALAGFRGGDYLARLVEQSPSLQMVRKPSPISYISEQIKQFGLITIDTLEGTRRNSTNVSSMLFGNTVGLVATRHGKLYAREDVAARMMQTLQAGDILLEKTPFRLTDTFIPGHWGHAALWIGSEQELRSLGIWDNPLVRPYWKEIRQGRGVIEALRSGVEINTARNFLNIDDLAVLRHKHLDAAARAQVVLQAFSHLGKPYDFNFDVESTDRIFCSKLVYLAYGDLNWPTSRMLGRSTISPDNVAQRALRDGPLSIVLLYHEGAEVPASTASGEMEKLVQPVKIASR